MSTITGVARFRDLARFGGHGTQISGCAMMTIVTILVVACEVALASGGTKPNVIIVITDDQGYGDMSCHGNPYLVTPEIDKLASDSVRLADFHVDPTCSPTRAALMTGRYSTRVGVWLTYGSRHHLQRDEITIADVFGDAGYRTAIFGKWHLGDNYPFRPHDRGFDETLIHGGGMIGETPDYWNNDYYDDVYFRNGKPESVEGYCTDVWFDESIKFIDRNKEGPFLLVLSTNAPHGPLHVPAKYSQKYRGESGVNAERACFYGMIDCIDENLGRLRTHLSESNLDRNTIIVFLNDNGTGHGALLKKDGKGNRDGWAEAGFNANLRGRKASAYEGGHRAACFIHWPEGGLVSGREFDGLTAHFDLMPTLIDLCGVQLKKPIQFDGVSIARSLKKGDERVGPRTLVVHHQGRFGKRLGDGMPIYGKDFSVMSGKWRLVGKELYDLYADPEQRTDVAAVHPEVEARLVKEYESWWADVSTGFENPNAFIIDPSKQRVVKVTSQNLLGDNVAYSQHHVRNAMKLKDCWTWLDVKEQGIYRFTVRRWPMEIDVALSATTPGHAIDQARHEMDNKLINYPSLPIDVKAVQLCIGNIEQTMLVGADASQAQFVVPLKSGLQRFSCNLVTADGRSTAAYYAYIEPASDE